MPADGYWAFGYSGIRVLGIQVLGVPAVWDYWERASIWMRSLRHARIECAVEREN